MKKDKRGRIVCHCGGYWFPHRKGSGACEHSKTCDYHRQVRAGEIKPDELTLAIERVWNTPFKASTGPCPF